VTMAQSDLASSPARNQVLLYAVSVVGAVVGGALLAEIELAHINGILLLVLLAAVVERQGTQLFTQSRVSVSAAAIIGAGILFGAPATVPVAVAVGLAAWLFRGKPLTRLIFNCTALVLAGAASAAAYRGVTLLLPDHDAALVAAALAAGLSMWVVNTALVGSMVAFTTGVPLRTVVRDNYLWLSGHFSVMGMVALGLALSWKALGLLGFAAFIAPVAVLALALRQGAEKARDAMLDAADAARMIDEYERLLAEVEAASEDVATFISARRERLAA
jgi:hypothetical protein